jgi:hypothetical protein
LKPVAPAKTVAPSKTDETEADRLRRHIRELEAKLQEVEKSPSPPAKKP